MSKDIEFDENTITIYGTRYDRVLFKELGCSFPNLIGQVLRVDKKEDGVLIVTRLPNMKEKGRCKDCFHSDPLTDTMIDCMYPVPGVELDAMSIDWAGPEFGCIHWRAK